MEIKYFLLFLSILVSRASLQRDKSHLFHNPLIQAAIIRAASNSTIAEQALPLPQQDICTLSFDTSTPIWKYFNYTGKSPNDLGFYSDCRDLTNVPSPPNYIRVTFMAGDQLPVYLGICFPQICKPQINYLVNLVAPFVGQTQPMQIQDKDIDKFQSDDQISSYMTLMIVIGSFFLLLGIIGMIIEYTSIGDITFKEPTDQLATLISQQDLMSDSTPSKKQQLNQSDETITLQPNTTLLNNQQSRKFIKSGISDQKQFSSNADHLRNDAPDISKIDILDKKQKCAALLLSFSLTYNLKKLVYRQRPRSHTDVLDGVRVLSIFWVVLGHSYFFISAMGTRNVVEITSKFTHQFLFTAVAQGVYAVDVFFFLSAFLGSYVFLKKYPKNKRFINPLQVIIAYFHRYYRLTPLLAFILYFSAFVIYPMASGPAKMFLYNTNIENCKSNGWRQIVYVQNFVGKSNEQCFGWGWYLSNDMQMFLILPWIIILYKSLPLLGTLVLIACFVGNFIVTGIISWDNDLKVGILDNSKRYGDLYYDKPWIRVTPYLIGIGFAMMYQNYRDVEDYEKKVNDWHKKHGKNAQINQIDDLQKIRLVRKGFGFYVFNAAKKSTLLTWIFFLLGFAITFVMVFVMYDENVHDGEAWTKTGNMIYNTFARGIFVTGLVLVLIPLMVGRLSMLGAFLSCQMFSVMAKITYSVYLIHEVLIMTFFASSKSLPYITHLQAVVVFFSFMILAYLIGGFFSLLVDFPLASIDKVFIFPDKKKRKENYEKLRQHAMFQKKKSLID